MHLEFICFNIYEKVAKYPSSVFTALEIIFSQINVADDGCFRPFVHCNCQFDRKFDIMLHDQIKKSGEIDLTENRNVSKLGIVSTPKPSQEVHQEQNKEPVCFNNHSQELKN